MEAKKEFKVKFIYLYLLYSSINAEREALILNFVYIIIDLNGTIKRLELELILASSGVLAHSTPLGLKIKKKFEKVNLLDALRELLRV